MAFPFFFSFLLKMCMPEMTWYGIMTWKIGEKGGEMMG